MKLSGLLLIVFLIISLGAEASISRDPFVPLLPQEAKSSPVSEKKKGITYIKGGSGETLGLRLEGIIWLKDEAEAIINGKAYKKGDMIKEGTKITKIKKDEVYVYCKDKIYIFSIKDKVKLEVK